jgi:hypothetical protein
LVGSWASRSVEASKIFLALPESLPQYQAATEIKVVLSLHICELPTIPFATLRTGGFTMPLQPRFFVAHALLNKIS